MTHNNIPKGATHYTTVMFLGLIYIKYIDGKSYWFDKSIGKWVRTAAFTEAYAIL